MLSNFAHLLYTNYIPSNEETGEIKQLLIDPQVQLSNLNEEIERIQSILNDLFLKRNTLQETINAHRALISKPRTLPHDVLQEIFVHCLPTSLNAAMNAKEAPILLGRICSTWRTSAYSTPQLWATLHIPMPGDRDLSTTLLHERMSTTACDMLFERIDLARIQAVEEWLNRSGNCPLSISYHQVQNKIPWDVASGFEECIDPIMKILLSRSRQWANMNFYLPELYDEQFSRLSIDDVPNLRSISLTATTSLNPWSEAVDIPILHHPTIHSLSLFPLRKKDLFSSTGKSWSHLTNLSFNCETRAPISWLPLSAVLSALRQCPLLTKFWLVMHEPGGQNPVDMLMGPSFTLRYLRSLTISVNVDLQEFLEFLVLPALSSCAFQFQSRSRNDLAALYPSINPFLSRVGNQISALTLASSRSTSQVDFLKFASYTPHLRRVYITSSQWFITPMYNSPSASWNISPNLLLNDDILEALTPSLEDGSSIACIWPKLEVFECDVDVDVHETKVLDFLETRNQKTAIGIAQIKRVKFSFSRAVPQMSDHSARAWEARIAKLHEDGIIMDFSWVKAHQKSIFSAWYGIEMTRRDRE
ncbi:hypothetical protein BDQ12DRAFT_732860 [Crucibulum laeve]|uniref:Uncharacterized protein n=1 Tax=Crucibulum laeve TaxID=68775 RepID=A0A5C3MBK4_9AGAR|nr:hypothetical protein BDQ12DRAFT_732860 [Crucibulum laeve]